MFQDVCPVTANPGYGFGKPIQRQFHRVIRSAADLTDEEIAALLADNEAEPENEQAMH